MFKIKMSDPDRSFYDPATGLFLSNGQVQEVDHLGALTKQWIQNGGIVDVTNAPDQPEDGGSDLETSTQESTEDTGGASEGSEEESGQEEAPAGDPETTPGAEEEEEEDEPSSLSSILKSVTGSKSKSKK